MNTDVKIQNNFVPNKNTLKSKGSIDKFSISSSRMEMMSLSWVDNYVGRQLV